MPTYTYSMDVIKERLAMGLFSSGEAKHAINDLDVHYANGYITASEKEYYAEQLKKFI